MHGVGGAPTEARDDRGLRHDVAAAAVTPADPSAFALSDSASR